MATDAILKADPASTICALISGAKTDTTHDPADSGRSARASRVGMVVAHLACGHMARVPYDHALKFLADLDPEALLRLLRIEVVRPAAVVPLPREVQALLRVPDLLYELEDDTRRHIVHIETQTRYEAAVPGRMLEYAVLIWLRHRRPIVSTLLLLTARGAPAGVPPDVDVSAGDLALTFRYRIVRLWQVPAQVVLTLGRPTLLPLVPLMRTTEEDLEDAVRQIEAVADPALRRELHEYFVLLSGLRFRRKQSPSIERGAPMFSFEESSVVQYYVKKAVRGVRRQAERQGERQGEARLLRRLLESRFGPLPSWASQKIETADRRTLEGWAVRIFEIQKLEDLLTPPVPPA